MVRPKTQAKKAGQKRPVLGIKQQWRFDLKRVRERIWELYLKLEKLDNDKDPKYHLIYKRIGRLEQRENNLIDKIYYFKNVLRC